MRVVCSILLSVTFLLVHVAAFQPRPQSTSPNAVGGGWGSTSGSPTTIAVTADDIGRRFGVRSARTKARYKIVTTLLPMTTTTASNTYRPLTKIIIAGAPASGKGTQCERIKQRFGVVHLSTGDMLREAVAAGTEVGKKAKSYMDSGKLVPDEVIIGIVSTLGRIVHTI
jgi:hypothetical protein